MSQPSAVYSTATLQKSNAPTYRSLEGTLDGSLLKALDKIGYQYMTPVQHKVLTELPTLTSDCLVQAKTGTGKTIAFLLPVLQNMLLGNRPPKGQVAALILCPTRELALQIAKECNLLTAYLPQKLECHTAFGGTGRASNLKKFLNGNPGILVATPGRLNDYLSEEEAARKFGNLQALILDEADRMLDQGFLPSIKQILRQIPPKSKGWQGMCFSATIPEGVSDVLKNVMKPGYKQLSTMDPNETPTVDRVPQFSVILPSIQQSFTGLYELIKQERAQAGVNDFKAIIFGTTAKGTAVLAAVFEKLFPDLQVWQLQSRLSQTARTRTTEEFKATSSGLLFASDVVGRGMDFPNIGLVIQLGLPATAEQYIHRVGRTARAGKDGRAVIVLSKNEAFFVQTNKQLPIQRYPTDITAGIPTSEATVLEAFALVDEDVKAKAYTAFLGFNKGFAKKLRLDNEGLVHVANAYSEAMGMPEPPMVDKKIVGKMGLKGVRGLRVGTATVDENSEPRRGPVQRNQRAAMYRGTAQGGGAAVQNGGGRGQPIPQEFAHESERGPAFGGRRQNGSGNGTARSSGKRRGGPNESDGRARKR